MKYLGGKKLIAKDIAEIIYPSVNRIYVEPFCGGLWSAVAMANLVTPQKTVLMLIDIHPDLIELYRALYNNTIELPTNVSEDTYNEYKRKPTSALRGFIGFASSFVGKWFGGYARGGKRNFVAEAKRSLEKKFALLRQHIVIFMCMSYTHVSNLLFSDATIYCDPPYKNTTAYEGTNAFDHSAYYQTLSVWKNRNWNVFCSEYELPIGIQIWEKRKHKSATIDSTNSFAIERLYRI